MISKYIFKQFIIRIALVIISAFSAGYLYFRYPDKLIFAGICILISSILAYKLLQYLNYSNRKIKYFLDSVHNNDSMLAFNTSNNDRSTKELLMGLNVVNQQIQQLKIEIKQQEQYFQTLLEHTATGIIAINNKGFIIHANSSAKKLLSLEVLTHIAQVERVDKQLAQILYHIKPFEQRLVSIPNKLGMIDLSIKSTAFKTPKEEYRILSIQDIRNELDEKELDSWLKLIRVMMHEIMNSITPITSLSESLEKHFEVNGRPISPTEISENTIQSTVQGLKVIKEQGIGLKIFVESYRKLTRLPKPNSQTFNVYNFLERLKILSLSLDNVDNAKISFNVTPSDLEIYADYNLISQVLINLIKNALQATENTSKAHIQIEARVNSYNRPEISVIDNGCGIAPEIMNEIFVPFFTTQTNGSGIGLSISKQIMRLHGGKLTATSKPKETIFTLQF